ncbi:hypothetical protein CHGG_06521 [Chaetomium globosum CBS 148.51]|uniref:Autophagy-related protein 29 n=1 Tax=Chaetomium globosum (strain ATCC 6205 / CBS 148.51 / DSM 1962 / NBRC 6347 / NRRL 1970) TaxID=306901 RepID=Q2H494_CHAGB|nr:uncharacterized protein CHGG_06521 [Chaetomium globosum CBS 148.51]EAQ89902.1 hypothetical protein CHGG_06521 [Chaetomium globosum CBS 148.51]
MFTFGCPSTVATSSTQERASAGEFDVTVDFLLQMATYLTERHTSQLRAHMLKAAAARGSNAPSPVPGAEPSGSYQIAVEPMRRGSLGTGRAPSALSMRKDTAMPTSKNEEEHGAAGVAAAGLSVKTAFPARPESSRNSSSNTTVPSSHTQPSQLAGRPGTATRLSDPQRHRLSYLSTPQAQQSPQQRPQEENDTEIPPQSPVASPSPSSPSSSISSDSPVESRIIRRPPRFQSKDPRTGGNNPFGAGDDDDNDDDDDDGELAFLPYNPQGGPSTNGAGSSSGQDLGATLRGNNTMRDLAGRGRQAAAGTVSDDASQSQSQTSDSSIGSAAVIQVPRRPATAGPTADGRRVPAAAHQQGPLSPRRTAELAASGRQGGSRAKGASREGSDGTPSMGSSFSDLDDASVTQSALEEALASRMQDGTIGSRMSVIGGTIGHAFRSRYLPNPNRQ